jgi:hypothetical protein
MKRPCIFCQQFRKLTEEHLWSDWIGRLFGEKEEYTVQRRLPDGQLRQWETVGLNQAATVVCEKCNNEWMSRIETETKPVICDLMKYGYPLSFLPIGIATLAAFTFKNAIISDHIHRERKPFFSVSDCVLFMNKLRIPDGVQMWMASSGSDRFGGVYHSYKFKIDAPPGPLRDVEFLCFTWSAGYLVLQVLAPRWKRHARRREPLPTLSPDEKWGSVSVRFWPKDGGPVAWNPTYDLGGNALEIFKNRWTVPVNVHFRRS